MKEKLHGIIIPAVTPFDEKGEIDFQRMKFNYEKWNQTDVKGYMCLGSNGEFRALSDRESLEVIRAASKYRSAGKTLIAGIGRESLHETKAFLDMLKEEKIEVDYVSVITPCYFAGLMTDEAMVEYYKDVADYSSYPVLLYCAPGFVNQVCISVEAVRQLADHPNIYGIKDTSKNMMESYMKAVAGRDDFDVLAGSLGNLWTCLEMGGCGGVVSAANYFPDQCARFLSLYEERNKDAYNYLEKLKILAKETGGRASVAGVKCTMNLVGYQGGWPRRPILPVKKEVECEIREAIQNKL